MGAFPAEEEQHCAGQGRLGEGGECVGKIGVGGVPGGLKAWASDCRRAWAPAGVSAEAGAP